MTHDFHVIIPARYHSSRLPGKVLMMLQGVTILERVYRQALLAKPKSVIIATDSDIVFEQAHRFGAQVVMTASTHQSGTDRIAEVVASQGFSPDEVIVNVQADEPLIDPALILQVAEILRSETVPMATLCWPLDNKETWDNPNVVKVVRDKNHRALYFSRSPIPFYRENLGMPKRGLRHIGLYAYRASFLRNMVQWPVCELEAAEALEQLRVLWAGYPIKVEVACVEPKQDINTADDLAQAHQCLITD